MLKIFVSSSMKLTTERNAAQRAITELYFEPIAWENFTATSTAPPEVYREKITKMKDILLGRA